MRNGRMIPSPRRTPSVAILIPMKMKWLGIIDAVLLGWLFIIGNTASRVSLIFSLINFLIFFGPKLFDRIRYKMRYEKFRRQMRQPPKF